MYVQAQAWYLKAVNTPACVHPGGDAKAAAAHCAEEEQHLIVWYGSHTGTAQSWVC